MLAKLIGVNKEREFELVKHPVANGNKILLMSHALGLDIAWLFNG